MQLEQKYSSKSVSKCQNKDVNSLCFIAKVKSLRICAMLMQLLHRVTYTAGRNASV